MIFPKKKNQLFFFQITPKLFLNYYYLHFSIIKLLRYVEVLVYLYYHKGKHNVLVSKTSPNYRLLKIFLCTYKTKTLCNIINKLSKKIYKEIKV